MKQIISLFCLVLFLFGVNAYTVEKDGNSVFIDEASFKVGFPKETVHCPYATCYHPLDFENKFPSQETCLSYKHFKVSPPAQLTKVEAFMPYEVPIWKSKLEIDRCFGFDGNCSEFIEVCGKDSEGNEYCRQEKNSCSCLLNKTADFNKSCIRIQEGWCHWYSWFTEGTEEKWNWRELPPSYCLKPRQVQDLRLVYNIVPGSTGKFGFDYEWNGIFNFMIDPYFVSDSQTDFNKWVDANYMKVSSDGELVTSAELDWNSHGSFPNDYDANLMYYWKFNDNNGTHVYEEVNETYNGILTDNADTTGFGLWDTNSGVFDGTNDCIDASVSGLANEPTTLMVWAKVTDDDCTNLDFISTNGNSGSNGFFLNDADCLSLYVKGNTTANEFIIDLDGNNINPYEWTHYAFTTTASDCNIFVNGKWMAGYDCTAINIPNGNYYIGRTSSTSTRAWKGSIEDFKIYNKALTASEIEADYNAWWNRTLGNAWYESEVFDASSSTTWNQIKWSEDLNYNEQFDVNAVNGMLSLYHFNDDNGTHTFEELAGDYTGKFVGDANIAVKGFFDSNALSLDGSGDYVSVPSMGLSGNTSFSLSAWMKTSRDAYQCIYCQGLGSTDNQIYFGTYSGNDFGLSFYGDDLVSNEEGVQNVIPLNEWVFVTGTYDSSSKDRCLYVNGVQVACDIALNPNFTDSGNTIGYHPNRSNFYFKGQIEEFIAFDSALTAKQVQDLYRQTMSDVKMKVRSCDDSECAGESWSAATFEDGNTWHSLSVLDNRYFQYKIFSDVNSFFAFTKVQDVNVDYAELGALYDINFNVYRASVHLTDVNMDFNAAGKDVNGNSPFDLNFNAGDYVVIVSKSNYDSNTYYFTANANETFTVYLNVTEPNLNPYWLFTFLVIIGLILIIVGFIFGWPVLVAFGGVLLILTSLITASQGISFKTGELELANTNTATDYIYTNIDSINPLISLVYYILFVGGFASIILSFILVGRGD